MPIVTFLCVSILLSLTQSALAAELPDTIRQVKASIVGIATLYPTRAPAIILVGTGFVVGDGRHVITNAHVVAGSLDSTRKETLVALVGSGEDFERRAVEIVATDRPHDLVLLRMEGAALPALRIGDAEQVREGRSLAFTGFPLALALGLHPATHLGLVSAIVPIARPSLTARQLTPGQVARVREGAFRLFQLDGTAYPGNSGSPLYDPATGEVLGILNMVYVKGMRENALTNPSGISYAIPANHINALLERAGLAR